MTNDEHLRAMKRGVIEVQITLADHLTPVLRDVQNKLGRWWLAYYLSKPWYWRLWHDIRHSRVWRAFA